MAITNWTSGVSAIDIEDLSENKIDGALSPMILTGGVISEGNVGTVTISALTALLRTGTGATDPLVYITLVQQSNKTLAAAGTKYYVVLKTYASPAIDIQVTPANGTTEIGLGICMKDTSDPVETHFQNAGMRLQNGVAKLHKRAATLRQSELASGCAISDVGSATRQFNIASGVAYHGIHRLTPYSSAPYNPYNSNDDKFHYVYRDGAASWSITGDQTVISNTAYYDGAYGLGTLANNTYACHWVYIHPDEMHVYVVYGTSHGKLAVAEQEFAPSDLPIELSDFGLLLGCIIIGEGATAFTTIQMVTDTFFTGTAVADHGELAGLTDDDHTQYVKDSEFTQDSGILVGTGAGTFAEETGATLRTSIGTYSTAQTDTAIDTDVATHAAIKSANAVLGHVIVEDASLIDVDVNGKLTLGAHQTTHSPNDGSDALDCAAPAELASVQAAGEGSADTLARADHAHQIQESMADNHLVTVNDADAAENDIPRFTATGGLQGLSYAELMTELPAATDSAAGKVELALAAEVNTGTSTSLAITPDALAGSIHGEKMMYIKVLANDTALTTGDGKAYITIPDTLNGMNLVDADIAVYTTSSSGNPTVQLNNMDYSGGAQDILSTSMTIDAGGTELSSYTAATPPVINGTYDDVATGDRIRIDVDVAGTGTKGLDVILTFQTP